MVGKYKDEVKDDIYEANNLNISGTQDVEAFLEILDKSYKIITGKLARWMETVIN